MNKKLYQEPLCTTFLLRSVLMQTLSPNAVNEEEKEIEFDPDEMDPEGEGDDAAAKLRESIWGNLW